MERSHDELVTRLFETLDLCETGIRLMEQNLRRRHPDATPEELDRLLDAWLATRPGAEFGDGDGVPVSWPLER